MEVYQLLTALERNIILPIALFLQMWSPDQAPASAENVLETQILRPTWDYVRILEEEAQQSG